MATKIKSLVFGALKNLVFHRFEKSHRANYLFRADAKLENGPDGI